MDYFWLRHAALLKQSLGEYELCKFEATSKMAKTWTREYPDVLTLREQRGLQNEESLSRIASTEGIREALVRIEKVYGWGDEEVKQVANEAARRLELVYASFKRMQAETLAAYFLQKWTGWKTLTSTRAARMVKNTHRAETVLDAFEVMVDQCVVEVTDTNQNKFGKKEVTVAKRLWDDIQSTPNASAFIKKLRISRDAFERLA